MTELFIGSLRVKPNLVLAPMSGVTCSAFRRLIREENPGAVGLMVTEFISVEGLTRKNLQSIQMMRFRAEEEPLSIQIFGHDVSRMVDGAQMAQDAGASIVDINCGCPVPKVVRRGGGCELMRQPTHLARILGEVKRALSVPLTVKIRTGWDDGHQNCLEIARIVEESGASMLAMHGRTRVQLYRGMADWARIAEVAQAVNIPVVGSGDVVNYETAAPALARGVAGVMIGRGALQNPWIFSEIKAALEGKQLRARSERETPRVLERYASLLREDLPDKAVIGRLKQLASQMIRNFPGSGAMRKTLVTSSSVDEFLRVVDLWRYQCTADEEVMTCSL